MRIINEDAVKGRRVLVRLDTDIAVGVDGTLSETLRLDTAVPTLLLLKHNAAQIVVIGHRGRPKGIIDPTLSLRPLIPYLEKILEEPVVFAATVEGAQAMGQAKIVLIDNLRFNPGEENPAGGDATLAAKLAALADVFIFEAFGVAHRAVASTVGVSKLLQSYAGFHVAKEVVELSALIHNPLKPFVVVLGGAKIETKLPVVFHLEDHADAILLGGLLGQEAKKQNLQLPKNVVLSDTRQDGLDINGPSLDRFATIISKAQTVVWNGPLGKFEQPNAQEGTKKLAAAIIGSEAYSVVGGGETVAALTELGVLDQFDFVSAGGGAMLEFLAGNKLPALQVLS